MSCTRTLSNHNMPRLRFLGPVDAEGDDQASCSVLGKLDGRMMHLAVQ